jgi:hypothetical protein
MEWVLAYWIDVLSIKSVEKGKAPTSALKIKPFTSTQKKGMHFHARSGFPTQSPGKPGTVISKNLIASKVHEVALKFRTMCKQ